MTKPRAIVYVDGFNFYYGLKSKGWKKYYWLDIVKFFEKMMEGDYELIEVNYFSARPINDREASNRQKDLFSANLLNRKFKLTLGKYLRKSIKCTSCGKTFDSFEEKETDVRIATQIINDVYKNRCDLSVIVSADSDLAPSIEIVRDINPRHIFHVYFPPERYSSNLSSMVGFAINLAQFKARFNQSLLPEEVTLPGGHILKRPINWK
jgi:uncharacterized LabA/DUF88 family protein